MSDLLELTDAGLYCAVGDFYIDPWRPVKRAVVTHAHSDHARFGSHSYLTTHDGERVLCGRMGPDAVIEAVQYGEPVHINGVRVSLHPAGHILGSAQVRLELRGEVCVVSGDYKVQPDPTCAPFEVVKCHTFVSESTFGLPIYHWRPQNEVFAEINSWWRANQTNSKASIIFGYALGKSQRIIAGVDASIGPIYTHGAVERVNAHYRESGVALPPTTYVGEVDPASPIADQNELKRRPRKAARTDWSQALIVAPPSAQATPWLRKFGDLSTGFASGWMQIRGARRRRSVDRGFVLSDHTDWDGLMSTIKATGAERVWVTHGYAAAVARYLQEQGLHAEAIQTHFEGEQDDSGEA